MKKAEELIRINSESEYFKKFGRVVRVVGLMIESQGPESSIGDVCHIHLNKSDKDDSIIKAEVVGFKEEIVILMPYTNIRDISSGCLVEGLGKPLEIKVGMNLIGKVLDSMGNPIDNSSLPKG